MGMEENSLLELIQRLEATDPGYISLLSPKSPEEFIDAFYSHLGNALNDLEKNSKHYAVLSEDGLSAAVAGSMSKPGIRVLRESYSGGHVDLTFEIGLAGNLKTILGEAKIYAGPEYHKKGLGQLMKRYLTGRELQGTVIEYVKKPNIKALMQKIRDDFDSTLPEKQLGSTEDHLLQWAFISKHQHDSGEEVVISHLGCNLY